MKTLLKAFIISAPLIFSTSCIHFGKLTRRYQSMTDTVLSNNDLKNEINVYGMVQPPGEVQPQKFIPKTIFDLSPEGQQELIRRLAIADNDAAHILINLRQPLSLNESSKPTKFIDLTKFEKVVTITTKKKSIFDADRITSIDVALKCSDTNIKFAGCDKIVTNYATADLGRLTLSQTLSGEVSASLGGGITGNTSNQNITGVSNSNTTGNSTGTTSNTGTTTDIFSSSNSNNSGNSTSNTNSSSGTNTSGTTGQTNFNAGISGKLSASRTFGEEVSLRQRYVNLSAYITDNNLHFYQEGISGIDVSGNIISTVKLEFTGQITQTTSFTFQNLFNGAAPNAPDAISASQILYSYPDIPNDVNFTISYDGVFRKVLGSAKTISEADDRILYKHGHVDNTEKITLLKREEFTPRRWFIVLLSPAGTVSDVLSITGPHNSPELYSGQLYFDTYESGMEFLLWLRTNLSAISTANCKIGPSSRQYELSLSSGTSITGTNVPQMILRIVK